MNKLISTCTALALLATFSSCKKYLEKEPDNRAQLNSPEKVTQLLASAYPQASYLSFAETSTDNVGDRGSGSAPDEIRDPYMFRDVRGNDEDSPEYYWNACYKAIASANLALEAIDRASNKQSYSSQKGEALVARAYAHFMLATFFSKFYDPATAATDPGIPYVTEVENVVVKQYERKTVAYVYDMIEKDLLAGLPLIKDESYSVPAYHFTRAATHAFAARFYLFKKNYSKVLEHTNQLVAPSTVATKIRPWNSRYLNMTRLELFATYGKATEPANLLLAETSSLYFRHYAINRYAYDVTTFLQIGVPVPVLSKTATVQWAFAYQSYGGDNLVYMPKLDEYFVRLSVNADIGKAYVMLPLFTMEEALFNHVEALTYLGNTTDAISLLNTYLSTRIYNYSANNANHRLTSAKITAAYTTTNLQEGVIKTILDLKRSEFIHEGIRWFDILRYKIPVTHYNVGDPTPMVLGPDSKQRVFQIPQSAIQSGLELNPR